MGDRGASAELELRHLAVVEGALVALAAVVIFARHTGDQVAFVRSTPGQALSGLPLGALVGSLAGFAVLRSPARGSVIHGVAPLRPIVRAWWSIVAASLLAGFSEELLFRGALQPWIGIWLTSLLFAAAHGGTAHLNEGVSARKLAYLATTATAGFLLGRLYQSMGLQCAMCAHAACDWGILSVLAPAIRSTAPSTPAPPP